MSFWNRLLGKAPQSVPAVIAPEQDPEVLGYTEREEARKLLNLLRMAEADYDDPDEDEWSVGSVTTGLAYDQELNDVRQLARMLPTARRCLKLAEYYITTAGGPQVSICLKKEPEVDPQSTAVVVDTLIEDAEQAITSWYEANPWFSHTECIRRVWRDGRLCLWHRGPQGSLPAKIRIVDPERVKDLQDSPEDGIVTAADDILDVQKYLITRKTVDEMGTTKLTLAAEVRPEDFLDFKINCDSTEKLGRSQFLTPLKTLRQLIRMTDNEVQLRVAQSSITMVTEVAGGTNAVRAILNARRTASSTATDNIGQKEKSRSGIHQVVGQGAKTTYSHPDNNFSDAGPLINLLKKDFAASTGWSFSMVSCDTSEGNLASEQLSQGPVAEMIKAERFEYARQLSKVFKWIWADAGLDIDWDKYEIDIEFPELDSLDPLKMGQLITAGVMGEILSRYTGRLRHPLKPDPVWEEQQIAREKASGLYNAGFNDQLGGADNQATSAKSNALDGAGANQGDSATTGQNAG